MPTFLWHQLTPKFTWPSQNKPKKNSQKIRGQLFPQLCPLLHPGGGGIITEMTVPWACRVEGMSRRGPWRILWDLVLPKRNKRSCFLKVVLFYLGGISSAIDRDRSSLLELITTFGTPWWSLSLPLRVALIRRMGGRHTCKARTILPRCRFPSVPYHRRSVQIFERVKWLLLLQELSLLGYFPHGLEETLKPVVPSRRQSSFCF